MNRLKSICLCLSAAWLVLLSGCGSSTLAPKTIQFSDATSDKVKVMTFNIRTRTIIDGPNHWNHRKKLVAQAIASNSADIIGLQEAKYSQLSFLSEALPQYGVYAAGRKDGQRGGESCPVLYRKDRYILSDADTFWFSNTPSKPGSKDWGNLPPRICSWVHLIDKRTGAGLYVYNLHLDNLSQKSRVKSVQLLTERIAERSTRSPFVVMGDFNMEIDNPAMRFLNGIGRRLGLSRSSDAWGAIHADQSIGTRHGFRGRLSGPQIDHIRLSPELQAMDVCVDTRNKNGRYPSDHFPVIAQLQWTAPLFTRNTTVTGTPRLERDSSKQNLIRAGSF